MILQCDFPVISGTCAILYFVTRYKNKTYSRKYDRGVS